MFDKNVLKDIFSKNRWQRGGWGCGRAALPWFWQDGELCAGSQPLLLCRIIISPRQNNSIYWCPTKEIHNFCELSEKILNIYILLEKPF